MGEEMAGQAEGPGRGRGWQERRPWALGGVSRVGLRNGGGGAFARRKARVRSGVGA